MKKFFMLIGLLLSSTLFAQSFNFANNKTEVALTMGNNVFDKPDCLLWHKMFYGIRVGSYNNSGFGIIGAYEQANDVNCPDCASVDLHRISASVVQEMQTPLALRPYAIATLGYEFSSNEESTPDQFFAGLGAGLKFYFTPALNAFVDVRGLRKFDTDTTNIITTLGLAYLFMPQNAAPTQSQPVQTAVATPIVIPDTEPVPVVTTEPEIAAETTQTAVPEVLEEVDVSEKIKAVRGTGKHHKHYYVQAGAYAKSSPAPLVRKLRHKGLKAKVRHVRRHGQNMKLVVVGPYKTRSAAKKALRRVRRTVSGAFITRL